MIDGRAGEGLGRAFCERGGRGFTIAGGHDSPFLYFFSSRDSSSGEAISSANESRKYNSG